jgi:hypothetical protein
MPKIAIGGRSGDFFGERILIAESPASQDEQIEPPVAADWSPGWWTLGVVLVVLGFGAFVGRFRGHTVDDAFITFRYVQNWLAGEGLVFNPGERVEGYTNFLWVVLLAPFGAMGYALEEAAKVLGVGFGSGCIFHVYRIGKRLGASPTNALIGPLILAFNPAFVVWACGGLETAMMAFWVTAGFGRLLTDHHEERCSFWPGVYLGLATLTRPDGIVLAGVMLVFQAIQAQRQRSAVLGFLGSLAVYAVIVGGHLMFRLAYYGEWLPNTFYAKVDPHGQQLTRGLRYAGEFCMDTGWWLPLLMLTGVVAVRGAASICLGVAVAAYSGYVIYVGGDGLGMYRFFVPILPLMALAGQQTVAGIRELLPGARTRGATVATAVLLLIGLGWQTRFAFVGKQHDSVVLATNETNTWKRVGLWFGENAGPTESIAMIPAGAIPFYSGLAAIDMVGLNDKTIARATVETVGAAVQPGHEKHATDYVLSREPTYIVIGVYSLMAELPAKASIRVLYPAERELVDHPGFLSAYGPQVAETPEGYFIYYRRAEPTTRTAK